MTTDVIKKCVFANSFSNGAAIVLAQANGTHQDKDPDFNKPISSGSGEQVEAKYTTRFDDTTYYTA